MATDTAASPAQSMAMMLRALRLPSFQRYSEEIAGKAEREGWTYGQYLKHLAELELVEREQRRQERYLRQSDLPRAKTLTTLDRKRLPPKVAKLLPALCEGNFVERGDNVLAFGLPGRGKAHLLCAIGTSGFFFAWHGHEFLLLQGLSLSKHVLAARHQNAAELVHVRAGFTDELLAALPVFGLNRSAEFGAHAFNVV